MRQLATSCSGRISFDLARFLTAFEDLRFPHHDAIALEESA
jgi:hypothetical protein